MKSFVRDILFLFIIFIISKSYGQYTHSFTKTACTLDNYGNPQNLTVSEDGTIFLASGSGGLWAYDYDGNSFISTAHISTAHMINDSSRANSVAIGPDGTVFLANGRDGLRAYNYDGTSFTNTAHIDDNTNRWDSADGVAVSSDGTVFLANGYDGLRAYHYNGSSFANTAHINDFKYGHIGTTVFYDSTIFVACGFDGLRAYYYDGSSFTRKALVDSGLASDVALGPDGTLFLANGSRGFRAYQYDGFSFTQTAHIDSVNGCRVAIDQNGTVFLTIEGSEEEDLQAYHYDGTSFTKTAHFDDLPANPNGNDVAVGPDGTVFLATNYDGLQAYHYDGISFVNTAHVDNGGHAFDVTISKNGTVFLANAWDGLRAYNYDGTSFTNTAHIDNIKFWGPFGGGPQHVAVGPDGTVFFTSWLDTGYGLWAYNYQDNSFTQTGYIDIVSGYGIAVDSNGIIFLAGGYLEVYKFNGTTFEKMAYSDIYGVDITLNSSGTVFLATEWNGLDAYVYNDTWLTRTANVNNGELCERVAVGPDGTVFLAGALAGRSDGFLEAYEYNGSSFISKARIDYIGKNISDIAVDSDGTIFITTSNAGTQAFNYDGSSFTNTAYIDDNNHRNYTGKMLTIGPNGTLFLADGYLKAYEYAPITKIGNDYSLVPGQYNISQNYPNPFNPKTVICYSLPATSHLELSIYNILGQKVATLVNTKQPAGSYSVEWDADGFATGVYYYKITTGDFQQVKKMVLIK